MMVPLILTGESVNSLWILCSMVDIPLVDLSSSLCGCLGYFMKIKALFFCLAEVRENTKALVMVAGDSWDSIPRPKAQGYRMKNGDFSIAMASGYF